MMKNWLAPAVVAFICWGIWAFLPKIATQYINPRSVVVYEIVGALIVALIAFVSLGFKVQTHPIGSSLAIIIGALGLGGSLAYLYAVGKGPVSVVSVLTALYPILTITLAYLLLHEPVTLKQGIGMLLALVAIILLTT